VNESLQSAEGGFDVFREPWITCVSVAGDISDYGIGGLLARAHELAEIVDPSPLVVVSLCAAATLLQSGDLRLSWAEWVKMIHLGWAGLFLPLHAALMASLLMAPEHDNQQWKHLLALPLPRASIFLGKSLMALLLLGASSLTLQALSLGAGLGIHLLHPSVLQGPPLWRTHLTLLGLHACSALPLMLVPLAFSRFYRGAGPALGLAICASAISLVISEGWPSRVYPWSLPYISGNTFLSTGRLWDPLMLAAILLSLTLVGGLVLLAEDRQPA